MTGPRITIVTFAWPPRNSIAAHRPYSWAKYWSAAGARVRVLTARKYAYDEPLDLDLPALQGVEVVETDYAAGVSSLAKMVSSSPFKEPALRLYRKLRNQAIGFKNPREGWRSAIAPMIDNWAKDCDYVVSSYDPRTVHQIAAAMKQINSDITWVADFRDLWSLNHLSAWSEAHRARERAIERATVGRYADMVVSVSEKLARKQGEFLEKNWLVIMNGCDVNINTIRDSIGGCPRRPTTPLNIVYTGKIYPVHRNPLPLLDAIISLEERGNISHGAIKLNIYGNQTQALEPLLNSGRFNHILQLHGHVPREVALAAQKRADLLLLLESPLPEASGVLTGKIFEYMSTGVPILSLGSGQSSAIGTMLGRTKTGLCTEDEPETIQDAIMARVFGQELEWFRPDISEIMSFSQERQAMRLYEAMVG
jgi:glycosyltransferase involved in cell wall biosynthesis